MAFEKVKERFSSSNRGYRIVHRRWPKVARKAFWWLMLFELAGMIPMLALTALAQPDLYRTKMWKIGFDNKLNSNPNMIVYALVNARPVPDIPLIWSRTLTDLNVALAVITLFFLLAKLTGHIMRFLFPLFSAILHVAMVALFTVSTYGQIGPDYADPRYPSPVVWYLRYGCDLAKPSGAYKSCKLAQGLLVVTTYLLAVNTLYLGFSLYAMWPNNINDIKEEDEDDAVSAVSEPKHMEMHSMKSPMSAMSNPYTPRTQAFYTLDRQLPLRQAGERYG